MNAEAPDPRMPDFVAMFWPPPARPTGYASPVGAPPGTAPAYAQAAFTNELEALAEAPEGQRNDQLNRSAFNLAQLVASGHLPRDATWVALYELAVRVGLTAAETRATLNSAFGAGEQHPRAVPDPTTWDVPEVTVLDPPGGDPATPDLGQQFPALDWRALWDDESTEEWIVEPLLPARRLVALFSPPKLGKSLLMLELAVAISRGTPVLGATVDRPRRVLYVDFENDPRGDVRARLQAMGQGPDDLKDLVYLSFPRLPYLDTAVGGVTLLAVVEHYDVEVVVIDTISRAVGGEENDNDTWLSFYRHTGVRLKARGTACIRLDHTGKDPTKGMRGGSAKYGDVDAVWSMLPSLDDTFALDCVAHRLPISERHLRVRRCTEPHLHHEVDMRRTGQVLRDVERALALALDRIGWPVEGGRHGYGEDQAVAALRDEGWGEEQASLRRVREALHLRRGDGWVPGVDTQQALDPFTTPPVVNGEGS